jgi:arylsulfatase A-like enzyme
MRLRRRIFGAALATFLVLGGLSCKSGNDNHAQAAKGKTSVLLITLDTTRADRLGCYGNKDGLTPFLDGFAKKSALFTHCETNVPLTLPSHTTIMSGWLPMRHGVRVNVEMAVPKNIPLLAPAFKEAGYDTAAFISASVLLRRYGLDRGFDVYDDSFYDRVKKGHQKANAQETLAKAGAWLSGRKTPFFCWVHLFDPHVPYAAPEPYGSKFKEHPYDGEIAYMDHSLQEFFSAISATVNTDDLIVIFCGDHGEALGDHGEMDHGIFLYESTTHVPLLIHEPGRNEERTVNDLAALFDLAPTIRDLAGLPPAEADGRSLVPALGGASLGERKVLMESMEGLLTYGWAALYGDTDGNQKYILAPRPELYDLVKDPKETDNVIKGYPALAQAFKEEILSSQKNIRTEPSARPTELTTAEEFRKLASLGYIGGTFAPSSASDRDPKDFISVQKPIIDASILLGEMKYSEALAILAKVADKDPKNPFVYFLIGQGYSASDPGKAIESWKQAIKLDPNYHMAWTEWVVMLLNQGKSGEAAATARAGLASCEDRLGVLHIALAEKAFLANAPEADVLKEISAALEKNPDLARAYLLRGVARLRAGKPQEADADLQEVWKHATRQEVDGWAKDPAFAQVFAARPGKPEAH